MKDRPPPSSAVPRRLPLFSVVFRCFPPSSTPPSRPLPSPTRICLRSWGLPSFLMTAVLEIQGRGRTEFCRPVPSRALGSPPAGPYGGPGRLRTLLLHIRSRRPTRVVFGVGYVRINVSLLKLPLLAAEGDCCVTIEISCLHIRFFIHLQ